MKIYSNSNDINSRLAAFRGGDARVWFYSASLTRPMLHQPRRSAHVAPRRVEQSRRA